MLPLKPTWIALGVSAMLAGATGAQAAGFALIETSGSGMGNAFAGAAAVAEDASTIYFNPAGMTMLGGHQVVVVGHGISPSIKFENAGSSYPTNVAAPAVPLAQAGNGGNAGSSVFVPNLYASMSVSERLKLGLGVNAPFGFSTEYDDNWVGRFQALKSEVKSMNINPAVAYQFNDWLSLGAGINYQTFEAELTRKRALPGTFPSGEGFQRLEGDSDAWGWNVGALFRVGSDMRLGVSYRSSIKQELKADATVFTPAGAVAQAFPVTADIKLPDMASLSVVQNFGDRWQLLGDATWTHWSRLQQIQAVTSTGAVAENLALDFDDAWRLSFGVNYFQSEKWTFKGGIAWDQSPVKDRTRTANLPDADRLWAAIGVKYRFSKSFALDLGYAHLFVQDASINQNLGAPATRGTVIGNYSTSVDILSAQLTVSF